MKTRKLRLLSALLAVAMMLALLPTAVFAADGELPTSGTCGAKGNEKNVHWTLDPDGTMTISGSGKMADYGEDPETHTIYNPPWVGQKGNIKHLVVKDGVTSIGNDAFRDCTNLKNVDLSKASSLEVIKTSFPRCSGLESVELNEGLVEIGGSAFNSCKNLKKIHIPSTVEKIGGYCFEGCKNLEEVTFADDSKLETIAERTFNDPGLYGSGLKKITIPKSVKYIQEGAFFQCGALESVTFEPGSELTTVHRTAFWECNNMTIYYSDEAVKTALSGKVESAKMVKRVKVTFISNGGSDVKAKTVENGKTVSAPAIPTRKGYRFVGWYEEVSENEYKLFDFSTPIKDNITLYAQWEEVPVDTYVVTVENGVAWVEADAETEAVAAGKSICVPEGVTVHVKADETAFDGMAFERWEVRKGEVKLENDHAAETTFTMPAGEVQLEAMYQAADANDSGWDAATVVTGAVIGTGTAILAYHIGMEVYAEQVLGKGVAVPRTRGEVALLAWQLAGSPAVNVEGEPLSEAAQAEKWAVESGLMQPDAEGNFNGTKKMSKWNALRVLDAAKK